MDAAAKALPAGRARHHRKADGKGSASPPSTRIRWSARGY